MVATLFRVLRALQMHKPSGRVHIGPSKSFPWVFIRRLGCVELALTFCRPRQSQHSLIKDHIGLKKRITMILYGHVGASGRWSAGLVYRGWAIGPWATSPAKEESLPKMGTCL